MSQSAPPTPPRYQLPVNNMVGALIVVLLLVLGFAGFRALNRDNEATPVPTVDYRHSLDLGRKEAKLAVLAPSPMPSGWRTTSAGYRPGRDPHWHLGILTDQGKYVGLEESRDPVADMVEQYVDPDATRGATVQIGGSAWRSWTDSGGDYAVVRRLARNGGASETVLVVGSAPAAQIRDFAAALSAG